MSRERGWLCRDCRNSFDELKLLSPETRWEPAEYGCPHCGSSDVTEDYYNCEECDGYFEEHEMANEWCCKNCADQAYKALDDYLVKDKPISSRIKVRLKLLIEELRDERDQ